MISIIIPTYNEETEIVSALLALNVFVGQGEEYEVLLVDGGSTDRTLVLVEALQQEGRLDYSFSVYTNCGKSRGEVLAYGSQKSLGDILLFLHVDSRLHPKAFEAIISAIYKDGFDAGGFCVQFRETSNHVLYRGIEFFIFLRARLFKMFHGDQGIFVRSSVLELMGGFPTLPLMEDVQLSQRLRKRFSIKLLIVPIYASPRRIVANGFWRMLLIYFYLKTLYYLDFDINYIAHKYNNLRKV